MEENNSQPNKYNAALKSADYHADSEQRPGKAGEKENDGADPFQFKKFHAHIALVGKDVRENDIVY